MFVKKSELDAANSEKQKLSEQNAELAKQVETANAEITAANQQKETLAQEIATLKNEAETNNASFKFLTIERDALALQVQQLTEENTKLRELPGAPSSQIKSKTEINHGDQKTELDRVNDFCRENAGDVNVCMAEIKKAKL